jgi:proton glutamate symport protein
MSVATPTNAYETMEAPAKKSLVRSILTSLTFWIVLGTCLGVLLGAVAPDFSADAAPMKNIFLRPIQFIVFPLVFSSLVLGIADQKDMKKLGWLALKTFIYFEIITVRCHVLAIGPHGSSLISMCLTAYEHRRWR